MAKYAGLGLPLVGSSDAHFLEEIGQGITEVLAEAPTFAELALALKRAGGRGTTRIGLDGVPTVWPDTGGGHA